MLSRDFSTCKAFCCGWDLLDLRTASCFLLSGNQTYWLVNTFFISFFSPSWWNSCVISLLSQWLMFNFCAVNFSLFLTILSIVFFKPVFSNVKRKANKDKYPPSAWKLDSQRMKNMGVNSARLSKLLLLRHLRDEGTDNGLIALKWTSWHWVIGLENLGFLLWYLP